MCLVRMESLASARISHLFIFPFPCCCLLSNVAYSRDEFIVYIYRFVLYRLRPLRAHEWCPQAMYTIINSLNEIDCVLILVSCKIVQKSNDNNNKNKIISMRTVAAACYFWELCGQSENVLMDWTRYSNQTIPFSRTLSCISSLELISAVCTRCTN